MAVQLPTEESGAPDPSVLVSRQPVLDLRDRITGYRISYARLDGDHPVTPTGAEAFEMVDDVLSLIGHDEQVLGSMAHLPVSREMLLESGLPAVRTDQVLLRIGYDAATETPLVPVLDRAAQRGYALELDGLPGPNFDTGLLDYFATVEIDVSAWDPEDVATALPRILERRAVALAVGVRNHAQREQARSLGFEWFAGPFFSTPNLLAGKPIPIGDMRTLVELARLQSADAPLDELVALIERDLGLGVRLLRYINSAFFGLAGRVRSIRHAGAMLGARGLSRWALIVATVGGSEEIPRELALLSLTRARACELVSIDHSHRVDSNEMFMIGMLSAVDAVFRLPMEKIVSELPLADDVAEALLNHGGPAGEMLAAVIAYERGEFLAPTLRTGLMAHASAYREGLAWARDALSGMG